MNSNVQQKRPLATLLAILLPISLLALIVAIIAFQPSGNDQARPAVTEESAKGAPLGVWSNLPNFPVVNLGFSGSGANPNGPLLLKRAAAVAYPPNGKVYVLGGRHRPDGEDIGVRWIWEYDPGANTLTQKSALLDGNNYGDRYMSTMAAGVLTDTNGPRIYMVGGISMDSIVTPTVRVYDPNTDSITTLPSADNWPANPMRVPGGYAVHNNKLYIFGGHKAKPSTELFSDTWVFDPMGPSGGKWAQIANANLSVARAYIAGAVLDGQIYAIGGDIVISTTVTPVNNVERFNPANPGAGWQPVASLPYARGDMGAWAYDTGSGYEISGRIVAAGGGYPVPDTHAYIYNPDTNSWSFFADMLRSRRNFAYTQHNGMLYAWGGYDVSRGVFNGSNDSMKYDASGPPPAPIVTPSNTPIPSPTSCYANQNYTYTLSTGATIVPGTSMVPGTNCQTCLKLISLPFPVQLYGQSFTSAMVGSTGNMQLQSNSPFWINRCLPYAPFSYTLMPWWDDIALSSGGVYTSVTGVAPNRILNVEWRSTSTNFEIRLFEDSTTVEYIYGTVPASTVSTIGIQKDMSRYTQVSCNQAGITTGTKVTWTLSPCGTPTPTVTGTPPTATNTPTITQTPTRTQTPTITPTVCGGGNYVIATGSATIVPGTLDIGNHCDDCVTSITLPFAFALYDQMFTTANASSNGNLQFNTSVTSFSNQCLPSTTIGSYTIFPYWDDMRTDAGGSGIFTSVSGSAPNRIFNIEWRKTYFGGGGTATFEVRLYENGGVNQYFEVIYGQVDQGTGSATGGVQKDGTFYTQYFCNGAGGPLTNGLLLRYTPAIPCGSVTPIPTTATNTPTRTASPTRTSTQQPSPPPPTQPPTHTRTNTPTNTPTSTAPALTSTPTSTSTPTRTSTGTAVPPSHTSTRTNTPLPSPATNTPTVAPTACVLLFTDVPPGSTFYAQIRCLTCLGIVNGYTSGCVGGSPCFKPQQEVTRGQISKIVSNSAGWNETIPQNQQTFEDVPPGHTFWVYVERMVLHGILQGYACGGVGEPCIPPGNRPYLRPGNPTTRAQLAKITVLAAGLQINTTGGPHFSDVPVGDIFYEWIETLYNAGAINGYGDGTFRPYNNASRGQMSKIAANVFYPGCNPPR